MTSRFVLAITLRDTRGFDQPLTMAIGLDEELRIAPRAVDEMKIGLVTFDDAVTLMRRREFRKQLFIRSAERLGALLAERMEDAEGWHDVERIKPAREQLGGSWK